jgi:hypothetical protein
MKLTKQKSTAAIVCWAPNSPAIMKKTIRPASIRHALRSFVAISFLFASSNLCSAAGLLTDVPGLSAGAQTSLVAHYDGRSGVAITGSTVDSWTPVDGNGTALPGMVVTNTGTGASSLLTYDGFGTISFGDGPGSTRRLNGALANAASASVTVFWRGFYDPSAAFATSGTYAYNIGPNDISHQRDDGGGGFRVEMYNGTTYAGDDIMSYDNIPTVWSTVLTANSHTAFANGTNLNLTGTPTNSLAANANIDIGAYSGSGYDFVGDMSDLIIFESALSDADRGLVEAHLMNVPEPSTTVLVGLCLLSLITRRRRG